MPAAPAPLAKMGTAMAAAPRNLWDPADDSRFDVVEAILTRSASAVR